LENSCRQQRWGNRTFWSCFASCDISSGHQVSVTDNHFLLYIFLWVQNWSWESSDGTAIGYRLDSWGIGLRFLAGGRDFSLLNNVQTSFGALPASCQICTTGCFPRYKVTGGMHDTDHSLPCSAEDKNGGAIPLLPHTSPWCGTSLSNLLSLLIARRISSH
jgi:hypothetical protein